MNQKPNPPALVLWLLQHVGPNQNREAIIGDLLEKLGEGKSASWFWREFLVAVAVGTLKDVRARWLEIGFALLGTALPFFAWKPIVQSWLFEGLFEWGINLQWPLSSIFDFSFRATENLGMLLVDLIIVLAIRKSLAWRNIARSLLISFPILAIGGVVTFVWTRNLPHPLGNLSAQLPFFFALLASIWTNHSGRPSPAQVA